FRHAFPLHRNLRPIFVSFHCNKRSLLTDEAIEYLKRYGPVGCRDWTTVYLLRSIDVPAFFSGCLTTTIDTVFPDGAAAPSGAPDAYVDVRPVPEDAVAYAHSDEAVRLRSFVDNVGRALELLETYRTEHGRVVTSRLHCYLPVRSIGLDVEFRPNNPSDVRFDGLAGIGDRAFASMRAGLDDKLEQVLGAIFAGRPEDEVYALWREITAADVAAAEEQRRRGAKLAPADLDEPVATAVARTRGPEPREDEVHVAVELPQGAGFDLQVLVASLLEHCSRPLHVWVLARPGTGGGIKRLRERFPDLAISRVALGQLAGGPLRVLLADLVPVDRLVVLPLPAVATADVAELAELDLGGHAFAAPTPPGRDVSGFAVLHAAAARLGSRTEASAALRRTAHARHAFDFDAFTTDVLVLDLARLRSERLSAEALPLVSELGLDDTEALHYLAGPGRAVVPERWATVPTRVPVRGDGLLHWADGVKPSQPELVPERDRWRAYASAVKRQAG
ncbi:MAG TPA: hypothetical protein VNO82_12485, partial [Solirubrobacteraceae bacterium]|nr:hypothetical protein [Solirubrobacteraceae bacterium]